MKSGTRKWLILAVVCLLTIMQQCDKNALSVAAVPITKSLGFNNTQIGLVISVFFISYTAMNFIGGMFTDRYGAKKIAGIVGVMWSLFTGFTGLAWSFESLLIIRFLFGGFEGPFISTQSKTVSELFPKEKRGFAKSFITATASLGVGLAAVMVTQIINLFGWRNAFWCFAAIGFVIVGLFLFLGRTWKRPTAADGTVIKTSRVPYKTLFKAPLLWKLFAINFLIGVFLWGLNTWLPTYWMTARGLSLTTMGLVSFIPAFCSFFIVLALGRGLDKGLHERERYVIAIGAIVCAVSVFLTYVSPTVQMGVLFQTLASIGASCIQATVFISIVKYFAGNAIGTASGLLNAALQLAGVIAPAAMGALLDVTGSFVAIFAVVVLAMVVTAAIGITIKTKGVSEHPIAEEYGSQEISVPVPAEA